MGESLRGLGGDERLEEFVVSRKISRDFDGDCEFILNKLRTSALPKTQSRPN